MKYVFVLLTCLLTFNAFAQCSSCTISVTGADASDHVITIGQVLCVQPTGTLTGHIYVTSGGILCNQGHINSPDIVVSGGGEFDNYGVARVDTLYMYDGSSVFINVDSMTNNLAGASSGTTITNSGVWSCYSFWDTAVNITNNGTFAIAQGIYLGTNSTFSNHQILTLGTDFDNGPGSSFSTDCMVTVGGNWYNAGTINGPTSGCGGFSIALQSYNVGTVGDTGHIDLCDAGHPAGGIDGNSGTMTGVTFCQCQNLCSSMVGIRQISDQMDLSVYPNPAADKIQVKYSTNTEGVLLLQNAFGAIVQKLSLSKNTSAISLSTSTLSDGIYILTMQTEAGSTSRRVEIIR